MTPLSRSLILAVLCPLAACGGSTPVAPPESDLPERFLLASVPEDAQDVAAVWSGAAPGEEVIVRGVVGGAVRPFVDGLAAFTLVDPSLTSCVDDGMNCATPWDYCCEDPAQIASGSVTIEFREDGQPLAASPRGFHGLDHLRTAVVRGTVERDPQGNVTIVANGVRAQVSAPHDP